MASTDQADDSYVDSPEYILAWKKFPVGPTGMYADAPTTRNKIGTRHEPLHHATESRKHSVPP